MINKESTNKEILDHSPFGNISIREIGSMTFMSWVANKLNGAPTYKAATQELLALVKNAPIGKIPEGDKIKIVRKLLDLDVNI